MLNFEDILDDAVRYMRGEMDLAERDFFEELLRKNPHLAKDMQFMTLVRNGLLQEESTKKNTRFLSRREQFLTQNKSKIGLLLLCFLILIAISFFWRPNAEIQTSDSGRFTIIPTKDFSTQSDTFLYIDQLGGEGNNVNSDRGQGVSWLSNGQVAFSGTFEGQGRLGNTVFKSNGKKDIIFGTFDGLKGFNWVATIGGEDPDFGKDITSDSKGNLILTGSFSSRSSFGNQEDQKYVALGNDDMGNRDFFIAKFDPYGELSWLDHSGGIRIDDQQTGINTGMALAVDAEDHIILCGAYIGSPLLSGSELPVGGPNDDMFLAKYSPEGNLEWVYPITSNYMVYGHDVATDKFGNIFVSGSFAHHNYSGWIKMGIDTLIESRGGRDIFLAKFNPEGKFVWARTAGSRLSNQGQESANGVAVDKGGNSIITGIFVEKAYFGRDSIESRGGRDIFLAKYDPNGNLLWVKRSGGLLGDGKRIDQAYSLAIDPDGNIVTTGSFTGSADFGWETLETDADYNFFLAKYNPDGEIMWAEQFIGQDGFIAAQGSDVDINDRGQIVVTGFFSGGISIGNYTLGSKGKEDIFVLIVNQDGKVISANRMIAYSKFTD